jgi:hypothetical protein
MLITGRRAFVGWSGFVGLKPQSYEIQAKGNRMTGSVLYGFDGSTVMALSSLSLDIIACSQTSDANEVFAVGWFRRMVGPGTGHVELPSDCRSIWLRSNFRCWKM